MARRNPSRPRCGGPTGLCHVASSATSARQLPTSRSSRALRKRSTTALGHRRYPVTVVLAVVVVQRIVDVRQRRLLRTLAPRLVCVVVLVICHPSSCPGGVPAKPRRRNGVPAARRGIAEHRTS